MIRTIRLSILTLIAIFLMGCLSMDHGQYSVLSLSPIDKDKQYKKVATNVTGIDTGIYWAFYTSFPKLDLAVQDALKKHDGDFMTNVKIRHSSWMIPVIYGEKTFEVIGDVWKAESNVTPDRSLVPTR